MSILGNSNIPVTLNPGAPIVTLAGTIDAYGALVGLVTQSSGGALGTVNLYGAVGGVGAAFNVTNTGIVETGSQNSLATAIFLGSPGIIKNTGTIAGGTGIIMFGRQPAGYVDNAGLIDARAGVGVYFNAGGSVSNAGEIFGALAGIGLGGAGGVTNAGTITGANAITATYSAVAITNSGLIDGTTTYGVALDGSLTNNQGAIIQGASAAVYLTTGAITNNGQIGRGGEYGIKIGNGAQLRNTGAIEGGEAAIDGTQSAGITTGLYNAAAGRITGILHAVLLFGAKGGYDNVANAGYIEGGAFDSTPDDFTPGLYGARNVAIVMQSGRLTNTGTISGGDTGILISTGTGTIMNTGLIKAAPTIPNSAINLRYGGQVTNTGQIIGNVTCGAAGGLTNTGLINGGVRGTALNLFNTGTIGGVFGNGGTSIGNGGTITGGVRVDGAGDIVNTGTIFSGTPRISDISGYYGIYLLGAGTMTNTGVIGGTDGAIMLLGGGTVIDSGLITAASGHDAIVFAAGDSNRLILDPGAAIVGHAILNGALELGAGGQGALNVSHIGQVDNVTVDSGAIWNVAGPIGKAAQVFNHGTLRGGPAHGALTAAGPVYNYGLIKAGSGIVDAGGYVYNAGTINARGSAGTGIALTAPGYVINAAGASIKGATGVSLGAKSELYNYGAITGGVTAGAGGAIYNYEGGRISGGVTLKGGAIYNAGTIAAIEFSGSLASRLTLAAGASTGEMDHFTSADTIDLTSIALSAITGETFAAGILTLTETTGSFSLTFANPGSFTGETFALFADGTGTGITLTGAAAASSLTSPIAYTPSAALPESSMNKNMQRGWAMHEAAGAPAMTFMQITIS